MLILPAIRPTMSETGRRFATSRKVRTLANVSKRKVEELGMGRRKKVDSLKSQQTGLWVKHLSIFSVAYRTSELRVLFQTCDFLFAREAHVLRFGTYEQ